MHHGSAYLLLLTVARSALIATRGGDAVRLSGILSLNSSFGETNSIYQVLSGPLDAGWQWKEAVNVSVRTANVGWVYLASRSGFVETFKEVHFPSAGPNWNTCQSGVVCYCLTHSDYGSNKAIVLSLVEGYYTHTLSVVPSVWSVNISIQTPGGVSSAMITSSQSTFTSAQLNVSATLNASVDCFKDLTSTHTMIALESNLSDVYFLDSTLFGDQHNKIGYTSATWTSDFSCSMFGGQLWIIPESQDGTKAFYTNMGWDAANLRNDPLHLFKTGVYPAGLIEAILNTSNIGTDNTGNCQILSNDTTNATDVQQLFVSGSNHGVLNLSIALPTATFLEFLTESPSLSPSVSPSENPSSTPSTYPTNAPTRDPSHNPSRSPSWHPTGSPTSNPSPNPSSSPSSAPTSWPSFNPSAYPSRQPTYNPSGFPSRNPTAEPTSPTSSPTANPSPGPSAAPVTNNPSTPPTSNPTAFPSLFPSTEPTRAPVPTASFSAEIFGVLFVTGVSVETILTRHIQDIEATVATQLAIDPSRVIVTRVAVSSRRRLGRTLQSQVLSVDFTLKGYLLSVNTLKSQLQEPSNANSIAVSLGNSIPGAIVFDVGLVSKSCPAALSLYSNGIDFQCVSPCGIDQVLDDSGSCKDINPLSITTHTESTTTNYLARALYTVLGLFSWGFCILIFNVCKKLRW